MSIIYILIFLIGILFGSFSTLATYRIPLKKDITHERSFCPTCGHKLNFLDLIPLFSYIFLRGKCRYCGEKIGIRYFLIEFFFGIISLVMFYILYNLKGVLDYILLIKFLVCMIVFEILFLFVCVKIKKKNIDKKV